MGGERKLIIPHTTTKRRGDRGGGDKDEGGDRDGDGGAGKLELMPFCIRTDDVEKLAEMLYNIQMERSTAARIEDKDDIMRETEAHEGGVLRFDTVLKGALMTAVAAMPQLLKEGTAERTRMMATAGQLIPVGGDYKRAEPLLEKALEERRKTLGENHPYTLDSVGHLALLYMAKGEYARAEPLLEMVLE